MNTRQRCFTAILLVLLMATLCHAQTTSVTLQVTDLDTQTWNNGTWSVQIYSPPGVPCCKYNIAGGTTPVPNQTQSGLLSSSGGATFATTPNTSIAPSGTLWTFNVCPQAYPTQCFTKSFTITGASQTVIINPPAIRININNPVGRVTAYLDIETTNGSLGSSYFNLLDGLIHVCTAVTSVCTYTPLSSGSIANFASPPPLGNIAPNTVAGTVVNITGNGLFFVAQPTCLFGESNNTLDELEDVGGIPMWLAGGALGPCSQVLTYNPLPVGVNPTDKQVPAWDAGSGQFTIQTQTGGLSAQPANTVLANTTAGSAVPLAVAIPSGVQNYVAATGYNQATSHQIGAALVCADSSASGTAQSCTTSPSFTPAANDCIIYTTTTANTGAGLTLNVNALGAKPVAKWQGTTTLAANDVLANKQVPACYDGTNWELSTIGNSPAGGSSSTSALWLPTATTGTPVPTTLAQTDSVANQLSCMQFTAPIQISPTKMTVVVQTTSVGQSFQVGIYDSSLNLVKDSGALSCNSGGGTGVTGTVTSFTLTPGATYYQCTAASDATCAIMGVAVNSNMTALSNKNATREFTCANALAAGALPATCGTQTAGSQKRYLLLLEQ